MEELASDYGTSKIALLEYYVSSDYIIDAIAERWSDYGLRYTPTVCFNGLSNWSFTDDYDGYKKKIDSERAEDSSIDITATKTTSDNTLSLQVEVLNNSGATLYDLTMRVALYEDMGATHKHNVVRALESRADPVTGMAPGETDQWQTNLELPDSDLANVEAVVFLQDSEGDVLQAGVATST